LAIGKRWGRGDLRRFGAGQAYQRQSHRKHGNDDVEGRETLDMDLADQDLTTASAIKIPTL
jgi:hypothetical protein